MFGEDEMAVVCSSSTQAKFPLQEWTQHLGEKARGEINRKRNLFIQDVAFVMIIVMFARNVKAILYETITDSHIDMKATSFSKLGSMCTIRMYTQAKPPSRHVPCPTHPTLFAQRVHEPRL